ncbi:hypothetical protein Q4506_10175 [Colwellia sp. 4_MG-2023]|jgi:hypothetical protein|uniref:hypothetical protein n=1 Tax=unclassified Colwellia TaxID=196834 RepID=UPI001C085759|nr:MULTISPECIES: hypothetical protein [unclassified Colwellia]MBU2924241.1 hypothetical protein [Colwellia sp. C2M11]MDO6487590.1 hypothetical protein [Colwellia sp. 6_MG-2023]MDO6507319.1 hypothetical protein [Colwellia sp. 5_MG-2023]MDO6556052.1 hypothetical protein [Colwellia sp. 4_MG-2023]MDO6652952.1 hypothetical protein [Colwellia sp. 3_MG-2023]
MKKMSLRTRQFINDNIKINAAASSYPQRIVAPGAVNNIIKATEPTLNSQSPTLNHSRRLKIDK